jgi:Undecaprenyl-phosphate glucose phosphotransferase
MIRRRLNHIDFSLRLAILFLPTLAFGVAAYLRFTSGLIPVVTDPAGPAEYFGLLILTTIVWALIVDHYGLASVEHLADSATAATHGFKACAVAYVAVTGATFFYRTGSFSRLFVVISGASLFLMTLGVQQWFRMLLRRARGDGRKYSRILIIGADAYAGKAARSLLESLVMPSTVAGYVRLPGQRPAVDAAPVVELEDLESLAVRPEVDDMIIAVPPDRLAEIPALVTRLEFLCLPIRAILDIGTGLVIRDAIFHAGDVTLIDLSSSPSESVTYSILKRSFDAVFSLLALLLTAPLMLLIALLIRLTSPGPIFFVQERVGLNGQIFRMYKFRTMRAGSQEESETRWTTKDDPRRTWLGAILRRSNLDELPQFFNVLKGDMSVVGPRPERPFFVKKFLDDMAQYNRRHYLKVGVTGWAQVNGWRGDTSIARRVEHDLYYLKNWSLSFDIKIILLTAWRTLLGNPNAQ